MIGYIKIYKPELKMKDFQIYNAYYCGICKGLGERYGVIFRNLLNYDAVFLSLALDSINEINVDYEHFRCILHPVKKKLRCTNSDLINYVTDITVYMTYLKLLDDINDDNSFLAKIGAGAFKSAYRKSGKEIGELGEKINVNLKNLFTLENSDSDSIDETADCYGKVYSDIFTHRISRESQLYDTVSWMGYNIGRWIYVIDAYDDIENDIKKSSYNPILKRFEYSKFDSLINYRNAIRDRLAFILFSALNEASTAYELIDKNVNSGIIKNILYEGMYSVTQKVLNGDCENASEKSI